MKVTKAQLKQLINEELEAVLSERGIQAYAPGFPVSPHDQEPHDEEVDISGNQEALAEEEEEIEEAQAKRTAKGNVTQDAREKYATVGKDKFPIFDPKSAKAAIKLRGHASKANQKKIINKAAKYAPTAAKKARKADKK